MSHAPFVLTPAYGRDYTSKKALEADFRDGKDFVANGPTGGGYINLEDLQREGFRTVQVRYKRNTQVAVLKIPATVRA